jgi:hypothetical protein
MVDRVRTYLQDGFAGLAPVEDKEGRSNVPAERATALVDRIGFLTNGWPILADQIAQHRGAVLDGTESFVYWSSELLRDRPLFSATHVTIARGRGGRQPDVLVAGMQIFSTHYTDASLGLTALVPGLDGWNYLVYVNHSDVDILSGRLGGLVRLGVRRRLPGEARGVLRQLRNRLEAGYPAAPAPRVASTSPKGMREETGPLTWLN